MLLGTKIKFYVLKLVVWLPNEVSFLIESYLFTSAFNMSDSETNLSKFELGISNDLTNGPSNKFIFRATYGNSIVCNIFPV
jgi:hypothetical protein